MKQIVESNEVLETRKKSNRTDYGKVLIIAPSGYGKSYILKTAPETTGFINAEREPLPFKGNFEFTGRPKTWDGFMKNLEDYGKNDKITHIFIDSQSMAFDMLHNQMRNLYKGYEIYGNYNKELHKYFDLLKNIEKDIIVTSHDETVAEQGFKQRKAKVHGKEFEGRVEAHYTIVLFGDKRLKDGKPEFFLRTFQEDTSTKVPEDMFGKNLEIPNSAEYIFSALKEYYS